MWKFLKKVKFSPLKALLVRLVFAVHCVVIVYRVVEAYQDSIYWLLLISLIGLIAETLNTLIKKGGKEWTCFSPAIFCYLVTSIPPMWLLEIHLSTQRALNAAGTANGTAVDTANTDFSIPIGIEVRLDLAGWALAMEQALLFILILGRWFMPKGNISRNQLSQILLVYIGMAADIMELFEVFREEEVAYSLHLTYPTLSLWTLALFQYTLVISSTKKKKPRYGDIEDDDDVDQETGGCLKAKCGLDSVNIEVLGIMSTIIMQDGPFLCYRMYLLVGLRVVSQMMVFFTCKNLLVILLQIYRLVVICLEINDEDEQSIHNTGELSFNNGKSSPTSYSATEEINETLENHDKEQDNNRCTTNGEKSKKNVKRLKLPKSKNRVSPVPTGSPLGPGSSSNPVHRSWSELSQDSIASEHPNSTRQLNDNIPE